MLTPSGEPSQRRLGLDFAPFENETSLSMTYSTNNTSMTAKVISANSTNNVNGSLCHIVSLEVYRGRRQAFNISFSGFNINDNGNIVVNHNKYKYIQLNDFD